MDFYAYILQSSKTGRCYKGSADSLQERLAEHNKGLCRSTKANRPWFVLYSEKFKSRSRAVMRERYFKSAAGRRFLKKMIARW